MPLSIVTEAAVTCKCRHAFVGVIAALILWMVYMDLVNRHYVTLNKVLPFEKENTNSFGPFFVLLLAVRL